MTRRRLLLNKASNAKPRRRLLLKQASNAKLSQRATGAYPQHQEEMARQHLRQTQQKRMVFKRLHRRRLTAKLTMAQQMIPAARMGSSLLVSTWTTAPLPPPLKQKTIRPKLSREEQEETLMHSLPPPLKQVTSGPKLPHEEQQEVLLNLQLLQPKEHEWRTVQS